MTDRLAWDPFVTARFDWRQGEHVSLIGPTGGGKTTLALAIIGQRRYAVVFGTKPRDSTLSALMRQGWTRIRSWDERPPLVKGEDGKVPPQRLVLWPNFRTRADKARHRPIFARALDEMFTERNWAVFADEALYLSRKLKLGPELEDWWQQGRAIGLSLVAATQRPVHVPLEMYSSASHLFLWKTTDRRDLDRLRDIDGPGDLDADDLKSKLMALDFSRHEVLYVNTRTGDTVITVPPPPGRR